MARKPKAAPKALRPATAAIHGGTLRSQFGETYAAYARHTAALVPYLL